MNKFVKGVGAATKTFVFLQKKNEMKWHVEHLGSFQWWDPSSLTIVLGVHPCQTTSAVQQKNHLLL